jgi:hypothetical protein
MKFFVPELKARLDAALAGAGQEPDPLRRYDLSITETKKAVDELKAYLLVIPSPGKKRRSTISRSWLRISMRSFSISRKFIK